MKLPTSIENILNENIVESERVEFKGSWNPEPILHSICAFANEDRDYFITTIFIHDGFEDEIKDRPRTDQEPTKLTDQEIKILEFCKEPHSKKEIMEYMEYKHTRNFTLLYLKPLQEKGLLQMTIPDKPNSKNQKYIAKQ